MRLAVFDLDGTITRRDTLTPYVLGWLRRKPWRLPRLLAVIPDLLRFAFGSRDHGALKAALIRNAIGGATRTEVAQWSAAFVPQLLHSGVFADARAAIQRHHEAGDRLILMSASVDIYVPAIGESLGFAQTICSRVLWVDDVLDGSLVGENCREQEKLRQLVQLRTAYPGCEIVAYGNSAPDMPHLLAADKGYLVNGSATLRASAKVAGIVCLDWH